MQEKYLKVADLREVLGLLHKEEISFSRMVEMLNEKIEEKFKTRININIQDEVGNVLHKYGNTEIGRYKIQLLFEQTGANS